MEITNKFDDKREIIMAVVKTRARVGVANFRVHGGSLK